MQTMIMRNGKLNILKQVKKYPIEKVIVGDEVIEIPDYEHPYFEVEIEVKNTKRTCDK